MNYDWTILFKMTISKPEEESLQYMYYSIYIDINIYLLFSEIWFD